MLRVDDDEEVDEMGADREGSAGIALGGKDEGDDDELEGVG